MITFKNFLKESFSKEEINISNKTSRTSGAIGKSAKVPRVVSLLGRKDHSILDYGAGKDAQHTKSLRAEGFNVTAHEFGGNQNENHDRNALRKTYDHVYASNVLNTQSSTEMLSKTLDEIHSVLNPNGVFTTNLPASPLKFKNPKEQNPQLIHNELKKRFENVDLFEIDKDNNISRTRGKAKHSTVFHASNPKQF